MTTLLSPSAKLPARVLSHKWRRNGTFSSAKSEHASDASQSCADISCTTTGESSGDESDSCYETEEQAAEEERLSAAKRRRRAELDGLKNSVRLMEAHVVDASVQLRDLAALVAVVVAQRQQQTLHA